MELILISGGRNPKCEDRPKFTGRCLKAELIIATIAIARIAAVGFPMFGGECVTSYPRFDHDLPEDKKTD